MDWSVRQRLLLVGALKRCGEGDWSQVAQLLSQHPWFVRPVQGENCRLVYLQLVETLLEERSPAPNTTTTTTYLMEHKYHQLVKRLHSEYTEVLREEIAMTKEELKKLTVERQDTVPEGGGDKEGTTVATATGTSPEAHPTEVSLTEIPVPQPDTLESPPLLPTVSEELPPGSVTVDCSLSTVEPDSSASGLTEPAVPSARPSDNSPFLSPTLPPKDLSKPNPHQPTKERPEQFNIIVENPQNTLGVQRKRTVAQPLRLSPLKKRLVNFSLRGFAANSAGSRDPPLDSSSVTSVDRHPLSGHRPSTTTVPPPTGSKNTLSPEVTNKDKKLSSSGTLKVTHGETPGHSRSPSTSSSHEDAKNSTVGSLTPTERSKKRPEDDYMLTLKTEKPTHPTKSDSLEFIFERTFDDNKKETLSSPKLPHYFSTGGSSRLEEVPTEKNHHSSLPGLKKFRLPSPSSNRPHDTSQSSSRSSTSSLRRSPDSKLEEDSDLTGKKPIYSIKPRKKPRHHKSTGSDSSSHYGQGEGITHFIKETGLDVRKPKSKATTSDSTRATSPDLISIKKEPGVTSDTKDSPPRVAIDPVADNRGAAELGTESTNSPFIVPPHHHPDPSQGGSPVPAESDAPSTQYFTDYNQSSLSSAVSLMEESQPLDESDRPFLSPVDHLTHSDSQPTTSRVLKGLDNSLVGSPLSTKEGKSLMEDADSKQFDGSEAVGLPTQPTIDSVILDSSDHPTLGSPALLSDKEEPADSPGPPRASSLPPSHSESHNPPRKRSNPLSIRVPSADQLHFANEDYDDRLRLDSPGYKKWKKLAFIVFKEIANHRLAPIFQRPIKESVAPGYFGIIKCPMDLSTIQNRIKQGIITTTEEFSRDLILMCENALMFNRADSEIYGMAQEMMESVQVHLQTLHAADLYHSSTPQPTPQPDSAPPFS